MGNVQHGDRAASRGLQVGVSRRDSWGRELLTSWPLCIAVECCGPSRHLDLGLGFRVSSSHVFSDVTFTLIPHVPVC